MELRRLQAFALYENRPCRSQLNGCKQDDKTANRYQPEARWESRASGAHYCPKERDEPVVIPCLDITDQKDRCPYERRCHHPCARAVQGLVKSEAEERQHTDRVQVEDALGERDDITREGEGKSGEQGPRARKVQPATQHEGSNGGQQAGEECCGTMRIVH